MRVRQESTREGIQTIPVMIDHVPCEWVLAPGADPAFVFGDRGVLCFACSVRRGGSYDANQDRWLEEPNLEGFAREFE